MGRRANVLLLFVGALYCGAAASSAAAATAATSSKRSSLRANAGHRARAAARADPPGSSGICDGVECNLKVNAFAEFDNDSGMCVCQCPPGFAGLQCYDFSDAQNCSSTPEVSRATGMTDDQTSCKCIPPYSGAHCEVTGCPDPSCSGHGSCAANAVECSCQKGWAGVACAERVCALDCVHGECNNGTCSCNAGWAGPACANRACGDQDSCSGHGTCSPVSHTCECAPGWGGGLCNDRTCPSSADGVACNGHGSCDGTSGVCSCTCDLDPASQGRNCFTGPACGSEPCPLVDDLPCAGHGTCELASPTTGVPAKHWECKCDAHWSGHDCTGKPCPKDCSGHGQCVDGQCLCDIGYSGQGCGVSCLISGCMNGGKCDSSMGTCYDCQNGFSGPLCADPTCDPPCDTMHGSCRAVVANSSQGVCMCAQGWVGADCSEEACPGCFGSCMQGRCLCGANVTGFERHFGPNCEFATCPNNCSDHGLCRDNAAEFGRAVGRCSCELGWTGEDCAKLACPVGDNGIVCTGPSNGRCVDGKCVCEDGFGGATCATKSCPSAGGVECNGLEHGVCTEGGICRCNMTTDDNGAILFGWTGPACQLPFCGAENGAAFAGCSGHGECVVPNGANATDVSPICQCEGSWYGSNCQKPACPRSGEDNRMCGGPLKGSCITTTERDDNAPLTTQPESISSCDCAEGFFGEACEQSYCGATVSAGAVVLCGGHGNCTSQACSCEVGYDGDDCHLNVDVLANADTAAEQLSDIAANTTNSSEAELVMQAEEEIEEAKANVTNDNAAVAEAQEQLAEQEQENKRLEDAKGSLADAKSSLQEEISQLSDSLESTNAAAQALSNPYVPQPTTPGECIKNGTVCASHGTCDVAAKKCRCEPGWDVEERCMYRECGPAGNSCSGKGKCFKGECYCFSGYTGAQCETRTCPEPCSENAYCSDGKCICNFGWDNAPACDVKSMANMEHQLSCPDDCGDHGVCDKGKCSCDDGWKGLGCETPACPVGANDIVCSGQGSCAASGCICNNGFMGAACELSDCASLDNCNNHGTCSNGTCVCDRAWTGEDCSVQRLECLDGCGPGLCVHGHCLCPLGYMGSACERTYAACEFQNCSGHGSCNVTTCNCQSGWGGKGCEIEILACPDQCSSHGTCDTTTGVCTCLAGWQGKACDELTCERNCNEHGTCKNGTCQCLDDWTGPLCGVRTCPKSCSGQGSCLTDGAGIKYCKCNDGFDGEACERQVDGCLARAADGTQMPCAGHGDCIENSCECRVGWGGARCNEALCDPPDCSGNGVCKDNGKCDCHVGWEGTGCENKVCPRGTGLLAGATCSGHGTCDESSKECSCDEGWCGADCGDVKRVEYVCPGSPIMCSGHGSCRQQPSENGVPAGVCECDSGYGGVDCATPQCPKQCSGHGDCNKRALECTCHAGWTGEACDQKGCPHKCEHGRCVGGSCVCDKRWAGDRCETALCPKNCNGHGTCVDDTHCVCNGDWSGPGCESAPQCVNQCGGIGRCVPILGSAGYKCECPAGVEGISCEIEVCPGALSGEQCHGHGQCTADAPTTCTCDEEHGWQAGTDCRTSRCPNGCSDNGKCQEDGSCKCKRGFKGVDCSRTGCALGFRTVPGGAPCGEQYCFGAELGDTDCGMHGTCVADTALTPGKCKCEPGFWGEGCQSSLCGTGCLHGDCLEIASSGNRKQGVCECHEGFSGSRCDVSYCGTNSSCSGHGTCDHKSEQCHCDSGFFGRDCSEAPCGKDGNCNNNGVCRGHFCECMPGFAGSTCESPECGPRGDCSGHGVCNAGVCECQPDWDESSFCAKYVGVGVPPPPSSQPQSLSPEAAKSVAQAKAKAYKDAIAAGHTEAEAAKMAASVATDMEKKAEATTAAAATPTAAAGSGGSASTPSDPAFPGDMDTSSSMSVPLIDSKSPEQLSLFASLVFATDASSHLDGAEIIKRSKLVNRTLVMARSVCSAAGVADVLACSLTVRVPLQNFVAEYGLDACALQNHAKCDASTVASSALAEAADMIEQAVPLLVPTVKTVNQVKAFLLEERILTRLGRPLRNNDRVLDQAAVIAGRFQTRFNVARNAFVPALTKLMTELSKWHTDVPLLQHVNVATVALLHTADPKAANGGLDVTRARNLILRAFLANALERKHSSLSSQVREKIVAAALARSVPSGNATSLASQAPLAVSAARAIVQLMSSVSNVASEDTALDAATKSLDTVMSKTSNTEEALSQFGADSATPAVKEAMAEASTDVLAATTGADAVQVKSHFDGMANSLENAKLSIDAQINRQCPNNCSSHGVCDGRGICQCESKWDCSIDCGVSCDKVFVYQDTPQEAVNTVKLMNRRVCNVCCASESTTKCSPMLTSDHTETTAFTSCYNETHDRCFEQCTEPVGPTGSVNAQQVSCGSTLNRLHDQLPALYHSQHSVINSAMPSVEEEATMSRFLSRQAARSNAEALRSAQ